jgi:hypothetical protein
VRPASPDRAGEPARLLTRSPVGIHLGQANGPAVDEGLPWTVLRAVGVELASRAEDVRRTAPEPAASSVVCLVMTPGSRGPLRTRNSTLLLSGMV